MFWNPPDPILLGDCGPRLFRRVAVLSDLIRRESRQVETAARAELARTVRGPVGPGGSAALDLLGRLRETAADLDQTAARLTAAYHRGDESRLRDACCALVQVLVAYHPHPDLGWLGITANSSRCAAAIIRSYVRSRGRQTSARPGRRHLR